ncbi:MAG: ATP-binding protein [Candidatus Anammoxibacter sp.]
MICGVRQKKHDMANIADLMERDDPLTKEIVTDLIAHKEEDDRLDYKQTVDLSSEKEWLSLTKDISAFANTFGGYLVFGIDNAANIVGLSRDVANVLKDASRIQQKINRNLEPHISTVRSKEFRYDSNVIVALFVPQSRGVTHLISKVGKFKLPSGEERTVLNQGTFYIRRSAGNHLGDSRDFDAAIERRIDHFRESLIEKIARVVNSPTSSDVFILSKDPSDKSGERFIIEDSPDAIPIKGMSFTVPPEGGEEEIAAWSVIYRGNPDLRPPSSEVWKWYALRKKLQLKKNYKLTLFKFSLWDNVPAFYWIQGLKVRDIKEALAEAIRGRPTGVEAKQMLVVAAFLGESHYTNGIKSLGSYKERLNPAMRKYPKQGPRIAFGTFAKTKDQTASQLRAGKMRELNNIADNCLENNKEPGISIRWKAQSLDCFLYAQDDQYK